MTTINTAELSQELNRFNGSEVVFKNIFGLKYTEGVQYLARTAESYWLIDAIASHLVSSRKLRQEPFLVVFLRVKNRQGRLSFHSDYDSNNPSAFPSLKTQKIHYTDFPLEEIKLYVENGVLFLPSER
jgi:hypothetical protein